jgi:hypothetical protein
MTSHDDPVWINASRQAHFGEFRCALWADSAVMPNWETRFNCGEAPFRLLQRRPSAKRCSSATSQLTPPNGTVWFVGDSLTLQHAIAFGCRALREVAESGARARLRLRLVRRPVVPILARDWHIKARSNFCLHAPSGDRRVCYIAASRHAPAGAAAGAIGASRHAQRGDLFILNDGLHLLTRERLSAVQSFTASLSNASSEAAVARARGMRFAWRETSPQVRNSRRGRIDEQ